MLKKFISILWNNFQKTAIDMIIDTFVASIQEFRRANQAGLLDLHNQQSEENQVKH